MLEATPPSTGALQRLLEIFTTAFAIALHNAIMHATSEVMAHQDPLTGCANRRSGLENFDRAFAQARATGTPLGVLMFDLDRFKSVNDRFGHPAGDAVLVHAARAARGLPRERATCSFATAARSSSSSCPGFRSSGCSSSPSGSDGDQRRRRSRPSTGSCPVTASIGAAEMTMHRRRIVRRASCARRPGPPRGEAGWSQSRRLRGRAPRRGGVASWAVGPD